jgi:hypothetical protein
MKDRELLIRSVVNLMFTTLYLVFLVYVEVLNRAGRGSKDGEGGDAIVILTCSRMKFEVYAKTCYGLAN